MKLIDILVEENIENGWSWPEHANCITQDSDREIIPATCQPCVAKFDASFNRWFLNGSRIGGFIADILASDYATSIITREQYEAALAEKEHPLPWDDKKKPCPTLGAECRGCPDCGRRVSCTSDDITDDAVRAEMGMNSRPLDAALAAKNDGWIEWGGGDCPLDHGLIIDAKDRDGYIHYGEVVGKSLYIDDIFWNRGVCALEDNEIIAYRLHQPQEVEQEEADDEADLNECIGQDAAPLWSGEGLPPVGAKVVFFINPRFEYPIQGMPTEGREIEVVAHKKTSDGNDVAVCYWDENGGGRAVCLVPESLMPAKS